MAVFWPNCEIKSRIPCLEACGSIVFWPYPFLHFFYFKIYKACILYFYSIRLTFFLPLLLATLFTTDLSFRDAWWAASISDSFLVKVVQFDTFFTFFFIISCKADQQLLHATINALQTVAKDLTDYVKNVSYLNHINQLFI